MTKFCVVVVVAAIDEDVVVVVVVVTGDNDDDGATVAVTDDACATAIVPGATDVEWGNDVMPLDMPGSALCHLPFCCNAALICAHRSLLHD